MKSVISKLFGAGAHISELEKAVLNSVRDQLNPTIAVRWNEQVKAINKVQRLPEGSEVNFYRMKSGAPTFDANLAFPNQTEELLVAQVQIGSPNMTQKLKASAWCVKGFIFSIEYEGSVAYFEEALGMDPQPTLAIKCELTADLSSNTRELK